MIKLTKIVLLLSIWITGPTRSGKTTLLASQFRQWVRRKISQRHSPNDHLAAAILVFAANDDNRRALSDRLSTAIPGSYPVVSKTPLGFFSDEVKLFWPLLFGRLNLKAQFPLRLRPETEQELATRLWLHQDEVELAGVNQSRFVRQLLDLLHLAGASGIEAEQIPAMLELGLSEERSLLGNEAGIGDRLLEWRQWCLERGLLSYGIIYELYWRYLLSDPTYQQHLTRRYQAVFADDVDDYPAITKDLFAFLLAQGAEGVFTYNPDSQVRLGLSADPNYLADLASLPQVEVQLLANNKNVEEQEVALALVTDFTFLGSLPPSIQSIQTISRAELLRETAEVIVQAVQTGVKPEEIAVIAPGLDEIARYTLIEILSSRGVRVEPLNEQRSLISSPLIRALLTLLALVYPGLGRLVDRDAVAEMLVVLSQKSAPEEADSTKRRLIPDIDPVRAGLLADYCYHVDPEHPRLLKVETFPRWDRLGHRATKAYQDIVDWLEQLKRRQQQRLSAIALLDETIKRLMNGQAYDQLAALRELMETAQHYWEVDRRLRQNEPIARSQTTTIAQFIELLRRGTITANPRPVRYLERGGAVAIATIFQYRSLRVSHRWQFWLDTGSVLWEKGGAATLFGAPLFLREWSGRTLTQEDTLEADQQRLERILRDLLGRVGERVFLCYSDLGVNGTEQTGPLLPLVHASRQFAADTVLSG